MHIVERFDLPDGFVARPYRGPSDHAAMAGILTEQLLREGIPERVDVTKIDADYRSLRHSDPELDVFVVERDGEPVAYGRSTYDDLASGHRDLYVFMAVRSAHLSEPLFHALADGLEAHLTPLADGVGAARFRTWARHPGPGLPATGEAAWLERRGYDARHWDATLVRPHLDDIPERRLPDGVEVRPVREEQIREILVAHHEAFRGEWEFVEPTEADYDRMIADPLRDHTLWQIAWAGDEVVGQVKPFIDHAENAERGYLRGYTEYISTHRDWRHRGIAGALLARALRALRDRGMTEAALGVDTNNPGGAFQLYRSLGFEPWAVTAIYFRDLTPAASPGS